MSARSVTHACPPSRAVTYFLEPLLLLAPFMREPLACPQGESQSAQGVQLPGVLGDFRRRYAHWDYEPPGGPDGRHVPYRPCSSARAWQ